MDVSNEVYEWAYREAWTILPHNPIEVFRHPCYTYNDYTIEKGQQFDPTFLMKPSRAQVIIDVIHDVYCIGIRLDSAAAEWHRFFVHQIQPSMCMTFVRNSGSAESVIFLRYSNPGADLQEYFSFRFLSYQVERAFVKKFNVIAYGKEAISLELDVGSATRAMDLLTLEQPGMENPAGSQSSHGAMHQPLSAAVENRMDSDDIASMDNSNKFLEKCETSESGWSVLANHD